MNQIYIYKTTNLINNKIYIGKSTREIDKSQDYYGSGVILKKAILKNGIINFKKEIICECSNLDDLNKLEKLWIKALKSQDRNIGYNIADGGDGGNIFSTLSVIDKEQYRLKSSRPKEKNGMWGKGFEIMGIDNPNYGNKWTDEQKEKASKHFTGKKHKAETIEKISKLNKGSKNRNAGFYILFDVCNVAQLFFNGNKKEFPYSEKLWSTYKDKSYYIVKPNQNKTMYEKYKKLNGWYVRKVDEITYKELLN